MRYSTLETDSGDRNAHYKQGDYVFSKLRPV